MTTTSHAPSPPGSREVVARIRAAIVAVGVAAGIYLVAVWTSAGQLIDQTILDICRGTPSLTPVPAILSPQTLNGPLVWFVLAAFVLLTLWHSRWMAGGRRPTPRQLVDIAALGLYVPTAVVVVELLRDHVLVRPQLHAWITETANSAPSGHAAAVTAAAVVAIGATPPHRRTLTAMVFGVWAATIEFELIAVGWHRLSDVLISTILVAGVGTLLPDPYADAARFRGDPRWNRLAPWTITLGAPLLVAVYHPSPTAVVTAAVIGSVMASSILVLARQLPSERRRGWRVPRVQASRPTPGHPRHRLARTVDLRRE